VKQYPICGTIDKVMCGSFYSGSLVQINGSEAEQYSTWKKRLPSVLKTIETGTFLDIVKEMFLYSYTYDFPYQELYGDQLFNVDNTEDNKYQQNDLTGGNTAIIDDTNYWSTGYIDLKEQSKRKGETEVYLGYGCTTGMFYTADKQVITTQRIIDIDEDARDSNKRVTIPDNARYVYLSFNKTTYANSLEELKTRMIICLGDYSSYQPYTGGIPMPNIEYPFFEIKNMIDAGTKLGIESYNKWSYGDVTVENGANTNSITTNIKLNNHQYAMMFDVTKNETEYAIMFACMKGTQTTSTVVNATYDEYYGRYKCSLPYDLGECTIVGVGFSNASDNSGVTFSNICLGEKVTLPYSNDRDYRSPQYASLGLEEPMFCIPVDFTKELNATISAMLQRKSLLCFYQYRGAYYCSDVVQYFPPSIEEGYEHSSVYIARRIKVIYLNECTTWKSTTEYLADNNTRTFTFVLDKTNYTRMSVPFYSDGSPLVFSNIALYNEQKKANTFRMSTESGSVNQNVSFTIDESYFVGLTTEAERLTKFKELCENINAYIEYNSENTNEVYHDNDDVSNGFNALQFNKGLNDYLCLSNYNDAYVEITAKGKSEQEVL